MLLRKAVLYVQPVTSLSFRICGKAAVVTKLISGCTTGDYITDRDDLHQHWVWDIISNCIHIILWNAITHPYRNFHGDLAKSSMNLRLGRVFISYN